MKRLILLIILIPYTATAGPNITFTNGKWETSFNYGPCVQKATTWPAPAPTNCSTVQNDGIYWDWGGGYAVYAGEGHGTEVTTGSNYPGGQGGNGFRQWVWSTGADNYQTAPARVGFATPQKELWIRWYERYEEGFEWIGLGFQPKSIYLRAIAASADRADGVPIGYPIGPGSPYANMTNTNVLRVYNQGGGGGDYPTSSSSGWFKIHPSGVSNGGWHEYEIHLKMDTTQSPANGIGQIWLDGELVSSVTNVNWSNGDVDALLGWSYFELVGNKKDPTLARAYYIDIDDLTIYTTTPPNQDAQGNAYIGLITSSINGTCGTANGGNFASLNSGSPNLCASGTVASFTGAGPWTWDCNGLYGGTHTACSATLLSSPLLASHKGRLNGQLR